MNVSVNYDRCAGHGQCLLGAPTVFDLEDDADQVTLLDPQPDDSLRASVQRAASMCPASAIVVEE